jgi:hypothetical protein
MQPMQSALNNLVKYSGRYNKRNIEAIMIAKLPPDDFCVD